jgi:hypothetical protein
VTHRTLRVREPIDVLIEEEVNATLVRFAMGGGESQWEIGRAHV